MVACIRNVNVQVIINKDSALGLELRRSVARDSGAGDNNAGSSTRRIGRETKNAIVRPVTDIQVAIPVDIGSIAASECVVASSGSDRKSVV